MHFLTEKVWTEHVIITYILDGYNKLVRPQDPLVNVTHNLVPRHFLHFVSIQIYNVLKIIQLQMIYSEGLDLYVIFFPNTKRQFNSFLMENSILGYLTVCLNFFSPK